MMTIGLLRHFKVKVKPHRIFQTPNQFTHSLISYDNAPIQECKINLGNINWDICYSSTLLRAVETAKSIYNEEIIQLNLLNEVPMNPVINYPILLPSFFWRLSARIAWHKSGKSQIEKKPGTEKRITKFISLVEASSHKNILVVTHGFFMFHLARALLATGYSGKVDPIPENGKLYLFKK